MKDQLRQGLSSLPRPKNDYEIVVEDLGEDMDETNEGEEFIADQADLDAQSEAEQIEKRKYQINMS
jgi:pre-mRNA-splicing factor CDC5/CEF1